MEHLTENTPAGINEYRDLHGKGFDAILKRLLGAHTVQVQYLDLTANTFESLYSFDASDGIMEGDRTLDRLNSLFMEFAEGPLLHDNDRERFKRFVEPTALREALSDAGEGSISIVYRRKFHPSDAVYSTATLNLYPFKTEEGHLAALLFVRDISTEIQKYNISLDEGARAQNHIPGKKTILVVEDNEMNREILAEILSGYEILEAENGAIGLELLQKNMMDISVVILDVQMPVMNGYDFLKNAGKDAFLSKIPVIVATGSNNAEEERICLELGASDFVSKPYNADIIRSRVANIIRLKESTATMSMLQKDDRTGLYTLQAFYYHTKLTMDRDPDRHYAITIFEVDHFKQINETYGEETGDRVLQQIANVVKGYMAASDIYGRFGAARFLLLSDAMTPEVLDDWIHSLFDSMQQACEVKGISFKAGIYNDIDKFLTVSASCDRAITALNSVGTSFDKRYALYDEKHAALERRLAMMEADMREAYDKEQFSVYYQPKHDVVTGRLMGAEALIRWIHPQYGFLSPGEFIPLFERNGFVTYADYYVLKRTCKNIRAWQDEGIRTVPISVNSSRRDFDWPNYLDMALKPIAENSIDPHCIHIEVTESVFSDRLEEISAELTKLREAGFEIEMDDFGSGYSSLTTLAMLPLDVMKLDMSFMKNYKDEKKRKVLQTCISLAKNLGLKTVCEGVEVEEQRNLLKEYGCDLIQGYYFSKPLPEKEFREYLLKHAE